MRARLIAYRSFAADVLERAVATYIQAALMFLIAADTLDVSVLKAAALSAIPAALSVVKSMVAAKVGVKGTAALLPATAEPVVGVVEDVTELVEDTIADDLAGITSRVAVDEDSIARAVNCCLIITVDGDRIGYRPADKGADEEEVG